MDVKTGYVSAQYHVVFDEKFTTTVTDTEDDPVLDSSLVVGEPCVREGETTCSTPFKRSVPK